MNTVTWGAASSGFNIIQPSGFTSSIPKADILFYSKLPNTEETLWADDEIIGDEYYAFGGWALPAGDSAVYAATGASWYTDESTPKVLQDSEILAISEINTTNIFFSLRRGLAVYSPTLSADTLAKVKKYYRIL